ncbi:hypothetical protein IFR23_02500 [Sphingomonas sp. CFBP 13603]|uniref:hypothetical protein n=1 Tax=Sphingomonas sp. CFBP 13603 TaxID=2774040 RepID=UPI0018692EC1|nr:hypothetical protein [Sphingomonas sp. CFBP 13603]MBE2990878.1 hypothetical protein [Sphingomonas sp. CFBP 13603]
MHHDHPRPVALRSAQPNSNLADQLERITPRFDELTQRARLGVVSSDDYNVLEEMAQGIASDLLTAFRGGAPRAARPPLYVSADGTKAVW